MVKIVQHAQDEEEGYIEMEDQSGQESKEEALHDKIEFEKSLRKTLREGDVEDITDELTPRALTKCDTNSLLMAMEVSFKLRRLAEKKGPDEDDFTKLANLVDEFTSCLLDPLKTNIEARHAFGDSLDYLVDAGINLQQKKFFAHPVMYDLMKKKWWGAFAEMKRSSWRERWAWLLLHFWGLFDIVLFPVLIALFYIKHLISIATRRSKEIDIAFVMNATSDSANEAFQLMKKIAKYVMEEKNNHQMKYQVVVHGEDSSSTGICFDDDPVPDVRTLSDRVDRLMRNVEVNIPALHEDLEKVCEAFEQGNQRPNSEKVLVLLTDHKICSRQDRKRVKEEIRKVKEMGIKIVPVGIGPHINIRELERIDREGSKVMHFGEYANPREAGKKIWHELQGKDLFGNVIGFLGLTGNRTVPLQRLEDNSNFYAINYLEYFTTPYFVFFRDTLSYLVLLGFHFALCLETSSIPFSGLEWAILVFFLGRILNEIKQFLDVKVKRKKKTGIKNSEGSKYNIRFENGVENSKRQGKSVIFLQKCSKYLSDRWNILDFVTVIIYTVTFCLRAATWRLSEAVTDNRALVTAGYLYAINTMLLTLRAFGHVMETFKGIGAIQIALFHIIGDVVTIFWQFIATILAFSIAITKVYMAERSFISSSSKRESACKTYSGLFCWWSMVKHLTWSLLGIAELDPLDSVDSASVTLARLLFGAFLIMGVILLVNMMIALLSNTYQRVEDNSLKEWSFKKAITIQTYSTYHPIPVPLNLLSNAFLWIRWLWFICKGRCKRQPTKNTWSNLSYNKSLDAVVENLQFTYFSKYGYFFPFTDESKMDHVLQETERNRQMANQIAHATFTTYGGVLPTGPKAWQSQGIRVQGCLLTCEGSLFCSTCKDDPAEYHGARYIFPFSPETPHFEVLIQETGGRRIIGVGVVGKDYGNHALPGWCNGTVGYHIDDGRIFDANNPTKGIEYEDAMAYRGDLIGCTVNFDMAKDGKVPIVFSLNGRQITRNEIQIDYIPNEKSLYPYIGIGHEGIRVLAMLRSRERTFYAFDDRQVSCKELEGLQIGLEAIKLSLKDLDQLKRTVNEKLLTLDKETLEIHREIDKSGQESKRLRRDINREFTMTENSIAPNWRMRFKQLHSPVLQRRNLAYLRELDEKSFEQECKTIDDALDKLRETTGELGVISNEGFEVAFKRLTEIKEDSALHTQDLSDIRSIVESRFIKLRELIQSNQ